MHTAQHRRAFWSRYTNTLSSYTLLPGSQLVSPYGQCLLDIAAHSKSCSKKNNHAHRAQSASKTICNMKCRYPGLSTHHPLYRNRENGISHALTLSVALLSGRKTVGVELSSPQMHNKRILVNLSHIIKLGSS